MIRHGLGERRIIEIIMSLQERMPGNPIPFGDDVSAVRIGGNRLAVLKCDMLVGMTDLPRGMSLWQASRKAVISTISDLAAKGVRPQAILASLGLPRSLSERDIREIGSGLNSGAREYGAYVLGGDTNESKDLVIDVSAFGSCSEEEIIRRDTANVGDKVAVTGDFGLTALGLRIIEEGLKVPRRLMVEATSAIFMPRARLREGLALAKHHLATASIDSSDGLAWSLYELAESSGVGFEIEHLPIHNLVKEYALKAGLDAAELALYGGEEYELIVTMKPAALKRSRKLGALKYIGSVTGEEGRVTLRSESGVCEIERKGYEHLKRDSQPQLT
ncbi:thiamine-phosphate kinase [Candidatus Bathyarchaeota archaeon]|nr:thiamine-phosphate kinase [Candidatus Bathyarchaeota archaeon]